MKKVSVFLLTIILMIMVALLSSCLTQKKTARVAKAYMNDNPVELAKLCTIHFKPETKYIKGETDTVSFEVVRVDSVVVDCPPSEHGIKITKKCPKCVEKTLWLTRVDTFEIVDKASIAVLLHQINTLTIENAVLLAQNKELKKEKRKVVWWLIGIGVSALVVFWVKFKGLLL